ncbi:TetR/AcrR family transcriptional regulator [Bifidobacterium sp. ESL0732]|uniref:TetR/AcrR family transcriptional regulator n=1 Tax=Bifidobacterium sp. ESL0732 TaxID=2983222 RepID=UPI0023F93725|nr:TetR/AcrR family transcriptional regulator [Bifidobacterium sp. ESL0732]WEV64827.1 TetR/AcrR family transcriptional regulator [Bifidobacterium sp. ESL0732]
MKDTNSTYDDAITAPADLVKHGYAKGSARREQILNTASRFFAEKGYHRATILDIAAACDISRAGLLYYFPTKEKLLEAVLQARDKEERARFVPFVNNSGAMGVLQGMVKLAEHNRLIPGLIELFVHLSSEASNPAHPAHDYFVARYARIRKDTARTIRTAKKNKYIRSNVDANDASLRLTALMDGLQTQWLLDNEINMATPIQNMLEEWMTPQGRQIFEEALDKQTY